MAACIRSFRPINGTSRPKAAAITVPSTRLARLVARADKDAAKQMQATGYVAEDNSGRGNIFPTRQQAYIKKGPDTVASQGLGGIQGGILLAVVLAAVAGATLLEVKAPGPDTLATVSDAFSGDSLGAIAARIKESL